MSIAFSTLSTFCFAWIMAYLFLKFIYAAWIVTRHLNRLVSLDSRPRGPGRSVDAAFKGALQLMAWSSVVALPVGVMSRLALVLH